MKWNKREKAYSKTIIFGFSFYEILNSSKFSNNQILTTNSTFLICTNEEIEVDNAYKKNGVNGLKALISRIKMR